MIEDMAPSEFIRRCKSGGLWQLLDVRETWEINIARIEGTNDLPMNEIPVRHVEHDAALPVAVLCHSGGPAADKLHITWRSTVFIALPKSGAASTNRFPVKIRIFQFPLLLPTVSVY